MLKLRNYQQVCRGCYLFWYLVHISRPSNHSVGMSASLTVSLSLEVLLQVYGGAGSNTRPDMSFTAFPMSEFRIPLPVY
jgi:hypothetical protein